MILASLLALAAAASSAGPSSASAPGRSIVRVTVFPGRAQVVRSASAPCGPGAVAEFASLPPAADRSSLRATGDATITAVDVSERPLAHGYAGQLAALDAEIRGVQTQAEAQEQARRRAAERQRLTAATETIALELIGLEMPSAAPHLKDWSRALDGALAARLQAVKDTATAQEKLRTIHLRLEELLRQRSRVGAGAQEKELHARVAFSCATGRRANIELQYWVGGATWTPSYDARADEEHGQVQLGLSADVHQTTGEDWTDAALTLSTAVPRDDATVPEIGALRAFSEKRQPPKKVIVRRDEEQQHAEASDGAAASSAEGADAVDEGLSVQLRVRAAGTVRGDGTPVRLAVASTTLPARFALRAAPRELAAAFRVADLTNTAPFPLLAGPVDLYRKAGLAGRSALERVPQGGRFHLSFGAEERVHVKRVVVTEVRHDKSFGRASRFQYEYRVDVESALPARDVVEIAEAIPVSELDDVAVALEKQTTSGYELNAPDGIVTWKLPLAPGQKSQVHLLFHVDVPPRYDAGNM